MGLSGLNSELWVTTADRHVAVLRGDIPQWQVRPMSEQTGKKFQRQVQDQLAVVLPVDFFMDTMPACGTLPTHILTTKKLLAISNADEFTL